MGYVYCQFEECLLMSSIGPAFAIPKALENAGISKDDVDFFEINEVSVMAGA
jgi:acetyl-CoA acetyltransferase